MATENKSILAVYLQLGLLILAMFELSSCRDERENPDYVQSLRTGRMSEADYRPLTFRDIGNFNIDQVFPCNGDIPTSARQLNGAKVTLVGEMFIGDSDEVKIDHFALCDPIVVRQKWPPVIQKQIGVYSGSGESITGHDQHLVRVRGTLEVGVPDLTDTGNWRTGTIYRLRLDRIECLGPEGGQVK